MRAPVLATCWGRAGDNDADGAREGDGDENADEEDKAEEVGADDKSGEDAGGACVGGSRVGEEDAAGVGEVCPGWVREGSEEEGVGWLGNPRSTENLGVALAGRPECWVTEELAGRAGGMAGPGTGAGEVRAIPRAEPPKPKAPPAVQLDVCRPDPAGLPPPELAPSAAPDAKGVPGVPLRRTFP